MNRRYVEANVSVVGKHVRRELQFAQRGVVIAFDVVMIKTKREVPFAKVRLESQRFQRFRIRFLLPVLGGFEEMVHHTCGCREPRMGKSELRIELDRLIVKIYR